MSTETTTVTQLGDRATGDRFAVPAAHTQGPWLLRTGPEHCERIIYSNDGNFIAKTYLLPKAGEHTANARLIAAAPELLDALQAVRPLMIPGMNWTDETGEFVKSLVVAAIAKATGAAS